MKCQFVINRYKEDIEWVRNIPHNYVVYCKGPTNDIPHDILPNCISRPNVGKDVESYLHHIIANYENLADINVFAQCCIEDHYNINKQEFISTIVELNEHGYCDKLDYRTDSSRVYEGNNNNQQFNIQYHMGVLQCNYSPEYDIKTWWNQISNEEYIVKDKVFWGCIFAVSKELIHRRPKSFYEYSHKPLLNCMYPVETHFFERTWVNIFKI